MEKINYFYLTIKNNLHSYLHKIIAHNSNFKSKLNKISLCEY